MKNITNAEINLAIRNLQKAQETFNMVLELKNIESTLEFTANLIKEAILKTCDIEELPKDFVNSLNTFDIVVEGLDATDTDCSGFDVYDVDIIIGSVTFNTKYNYYQNGGFGWEVANQESAISGDGVDTEVFARVTMALEEFTHDNQITSKGLIDTNKERLESLGLLSDESSQSLRDLLNETADLIG